MQEEGNIPEKAHFSPSKGQTTLVNRAIKDLLSLAYVPAIEPYLTNNQTNTPGFRFEQIFYVFL